ncbi:GNAT family N-acetyltransferase [Halarchaeum sp. P4]|uniref:GNAT family N-acetyltransferase n=1 Tax=Halarchaeum sp. P4 TaxID=3421639 RepID=UPI003EB9A416
MFPDTIETDRLELRRLDTAVDVLDYYEVCAHDPGIETITEYMTWSPHDTPKVTKEFLERCRERWEAGEGAEYAIYADGEQAADRRADAEHASGETTSDLAGATGLHVDWERDLGTLGCWLRERYWGRGYSGERADALLELAFETLELACVEVSHRPENEQSERAITKYVERHGGRREGRLRNSLVDLDGSVHDEVRYTITRAEYRAST